MNFDSTQAELLKLTTLSTNARRREFWFWIVASLWFIAVIAASGLFAFYLGKLNEAQKSIDQLANEAKASATEFRESEDKARIQIEALNKTLARGVLQRLEKLEDERTSLVFVKKYFDRNIRDNEVNFRIRDILTGQPGGQYLINGTIFTRNGGGDDVHLQTIDIVARKAGEQEVWITISASHKSGVTGFKENFNFENPILEAAFQGPRQVTILVWRFVEQ